MQNAWFTLALVALMACAACSPGDSPEGVPRDSGGQDTGVDLSVPTAEKYEFCEWRTLERTGDLATDLVGEWLVLLYGIDYGVHVVLSLNADGTYGELRFATDGCEELPVCFGAGPPDLCEATEITGMWSVDQDVLQLGDDEFGWELNDTVPRPNVIFFSYPDGSRTLTAATCDDCR